MCRWDITDENIMKKSLLLFTLLVSSFCLNAKEKVEDVEIIEGDMSFFLETESYAKVNLDLSDCYIVEMKGQKGEVKEIIGRADSLDTLPEDHDDRIVLNDFYSTFYTLVASNLALKSNFLKPKKMIKIIIPKMVREQYLQGDAKVKKNIEKDYNIVSDTLAKYDISIKIDTLDTGYYDLGTLGAPGGAEAKGSVEVKNLESGNIVCKLRINYIKAKYSVVVDHARFGMLSFAILKEMYDLATAKKK